MRPSRFIAPQLASLVDAPPAGEGWLFEHKYDGYRLQGVLQNGVATLYTRGGHDWSDRFQAVTDALAKLKAQSAILDGEVVVVDREGRATFRGLQQHLQRGTDHLLRYVAFDLLALDDDDLTALPFVERRRRLKKLLGRTRSTAVVRVSEVVAGDADTLMHSVCDDGLEGVIGKRLDAPYQSGRTRTWVKVKCGQRQELVVVGYTLPRGSRAGIGALLLAVHERPGSPTLRYAGAVGSGFSDAVLMALRKVLDALRVDDPPFPEGVAPNLAPRGARWVRPRLLAEVAFTEWTADGLLRHPTFEGMREDKSVRDIVRDVVRTAPTPEAAVQVAGITISNADRVVYPESGLTKGDVAQHMERVATRMLPHVAGRPLSFVRCPEGIGHECFFQQHITKGIGDAVDHVRITNKDGEPKEHAVVHDVAGLVALVQFGILEIHLWGCREDSIETPDRVVFDLDPDAAVPWDRTVQAALRCRSRLGKHGLKSWVKTTGGKGVHVVAPLDAGATWDRVRAFAREFAEQLEADYPHEFVSGASKAKRKGKIFVDWLRNGRGATWVAPWSTRARPGATVSVPLSWAALKMLETPDGATVVTLRDGGKPRRDPWAAMRRTRQSLP